MSVKIRLKRAGRKKHPIYRLVAIEGSNQRDGREIEILGQYSPKEDPVSFNFKEDRVKYWLSVGAIPSDTVQRLLADKGLLPKVVRVSKNPGVSKKELKSSSTEAE